MSEALEYIFGSKMKLRVIRMMMLNLGNEFTAKQVAERTKFDSIQTAAELKKLENIGFLKSKKKNKVKLYSVNKRFTFFEELKKIIDKCNVTADSKILKGIRRCGDVACSVLTGVFVDNKKSLVDLFIAGDRLNKEKIKKIVSDLEADIGREVRYSVMGIEELVYRAEMLDKFLTEMLHKDNIILINKIREKKKQYRKNLKNFYEQ
ncbi:MAG: hypothetical protein GF332_04430 [Candidatus Moranbacteria bacterium]|nr:hypothetical protein [Candidatus Moranbacteria bacterium]